MTGSGSETMPYRSTMTKEHARLFVSSRRRLADCGRVWCSAAVARQHRTDSEAALNRRNTRCRPDAEQRRQSLRWSAVTGHGGGLVLSPARPLALYLSCLSVRLVAVQVALLCLPRTSTVHRPPSTVCSSLLAATLHSSPLTACVTGSQLLSVRKRKHQPQPPAELCSAAAGTVQRPA